jgi:hypothetical protein
MTSLNKILIGIFVAFLLYMLYQKCVNEHYRFLGGEYLPNQGGYRAELNEECLQLQAGQQCILTDGTSGNCVQSGHCVANMLIDLDLENEELEKPYCTKPVFKEGCGRFCRCQEMKGAIGSTDADRRECVAGCRSWYSPL